MNKFLNCFIAAIAVLLSVNNCQAQAPNLGTTSNFILFTTTGAVGNTGISGLTGDVGTNNGAITGFGNVNGNMQSANGITAQCATDLLFAYNQLNSTIPTLFPGVLLGNGDTLTPAVYQSPSFTTLSANLILDALGDSNAVFIFLIEGPLSTNSGSKIILINGAQACNVFWKTEGVVSMASNTNFKGTLIANNAAINMSPNDTLEGRMLSTAGAINIDGVKAYIPTGCGSQILTGPAAPNLGSAACFALFSGNGSVTNSGITYASGDIGSNVGLAVGYNPLFVTGSIHPIPDFVTASAATDLVSAYTYLNGLPNDIELLFPAQFGNDLVLTPHTYHMGAATTFTGSVYLDARGNPNSIFVIKVNGAFSTGTFSRVELLNGADAKNVYWCVDGAVSIADYSVFNGTIIANNGAIELTTGDTINGRALTTTGALNTASVTVTSPVVCFPLSVNWLYFNGKINGKAITLEWATNNEINNDFYTIEKSSDGINFEEMAKVNAENSSENTEIKYSVNDTKLNMLNYYRVSQTDKDQKISIYKTIQVKYAMQNQPNVISFLQGNNIIIQTNGMTDEDLKINIYSMDGKKIISKNILIFKGATSYSIPAPIQKGLYIVQIITANQESINEKILID